MATYTVANGGGNIDAASTYTAGVGIPGVGDEILFTTTSGALNVNTTTNIQDIDFSNYTNLITFSSPLNVSRNIVFGDAGGLSTYTTAGTSGIRKNGTGNITANNKVWTASFTFLPGTYTVTLMDIVRISGEVIVSGTTGNIFTLSSNNVLDPERFDVLGDFTFSGTGTLLTGIATIKFTGTANQNISWTSTGTLRTNVKVDKIGGTLFFSGSINYNTGTFTYVQGNTNTGTSALAIGSQPVTLDTKGSSSAGATTTSSTGINWYNINTGSTITLTSDLTAINNLSSSSGATTFSGTTQKVYLGGGLTASNTITSTSVETIFNGTGTWSGTSAISCPLTINTLGTITITGGVNYTTRTFTYTSGTNTGAGTIIFGAGVTLNLGTNKLNVDTIFVGTKTLTSDATFTNLTTQTTAVVLSGAFNINVEGNLAINIATSGASTPILLNGTGAQTWTHGSAVYLSNSLTINKSSGTLTIGTNVYYQTGTLAYVSSGGTVNASTSTLNIGASTTLDTNGITWNNVSLNNGTITLTLTSDFNISGTFTASGLSGALTLTFGGLGVFNPTGAIVLSDVGAAGLATITITLPNNISVSTFTYSPQSSGSNGRNIVLNGSRNINVSGNITLRGTGGLSISGTCVLIASGSGTFQIGDLTAGTNFSPGITLPIIIAASGNYAFTGFPVFGGSLTYTSGTVSGVSCYFGTGATLNLSAGGTWGTNVIFQGTVTFTSNAIFGGSLTTQAINCTLNGLFNVSVRGNLVINFSTLGTATIVLDGTGNQSWTHPSGGYYIVNNLIIAKPSGTLTIGTLALPNVYYATNTLTYNNLGGIVDTATNLSTLNIGGNTTLNTNGITWYNFAIQAASILNLSSDFTWSNNWTIPAGYTVSFAVSVGNLTPTPTANLVFTSALVTLKNDIIVNNVTRNGGRMDNNKVNIIGNLSIVTNSTTAGTTIFEINGTGNQSWTATAYLVNPMIINKSSGTLTMGSAVYHSSNFTYTQGNVDFTTNNNVFWAGAGTYITTGLTFNTFLFASFGSNSITLGSDLYANTFTAGGNGAINGLFNIYSQTLNINNSTSGASTVNITFNGIFYCSGDCTFSGAAGGSATTGANVYVGGSCFLSPSPNQVGSSNLYMVGNGVLSLPIANFTLASNVYFDTSGKIVITGNLSKGNGTSGVALTMNLIRGNVDARKATLTLGLNATHTLTNMHKIAWGIVSLRNTSSFFPTLIMNEFFCGDATTNTNISLSDTTATALNAVVTFTDNFEKIAKFVNINGITFTRPQQLILITNQPKKTRNRGIRYNNDLPNGISKNDPSVQNQMAYSIPKFLLGDPSMIKTI